MSCNFSLFLFFTPLYIFLIYSVFFNKALQDLIDSWDSYKVIAFEGLGFNGIS
jgi:hypothetical protein